MLRSRIFPTLLLSGGGLVKTQKFASPKYVGDPINAVKIFNEKEVDELTLFDIEASRLAKGPNLHLLENIASESRMPLCYGGGVADAEMAAKIISMGYEKISISHSAIARPSLISEMAERIGRQSVVVTLDVKRSKIFGGYVLYSHNAKLKHQTNPLNFAQECVTLGAGEIILNSIDRDGTGLGYDLDLLRQFRPKIESPLSIVGGARSVDDLRSLVDDFGPIGIGVGSFFVLKGKYRAVLLSYEKPYKV